MTDEPRIRVGTGFDIHPLVPDRRLVLGGVVIPHPRGLQGYSDADVVAHAIIDALLGAAALGDIGTWFPTGDPKFADVESVRLLEEVVAALRDAGWQVGNVDVTVVAEEPRLGPHLPAMRLRLAKALGVPVPVVSVKGKTADGLGAIGRREGIAAQAVALIERT